MTFARGNFEPRANFVLHIDELMLCYGKMKPAEVFDRVINVSEVVYYLASDKSLNAQGLVLLTNSWKKWDRTFGELLDTCNWMSNSGNPRLPTRAPRERL